MFVRAIAVFSVSMLCSSAVFAETCKTSDPYPYAYDSVDYPIEQCPADIQGWMDRANSCAYMYSELVGAPEREGDFTQDMEQLHCIDVSCDYHDLFAKYEGDIAYTGALVGYAENLYGSVEDLDCSGEGEVSPVTENLPFKCSVSFNHPYTAPYNIDHCPSDIQDWLERADLCSSVDGLTDASAIAEAKEAIMNEGWAYEELYCDYIGCDFSDLFGKYEGDIVYTGILSDFEKILHGENGVLYCDQEQEMPPEERVGDVYLDGAVE